MEKGHIEIRNLEGLYDAYKNQIYTLCIRLTDSKALADDLFSDTWTKVAEKYRNIKHNQNPLAWIYTVCINTYRKSTTRQRQNIVYNDTSRDHQATVSVKNDEANAEELLIEEETMVALRKALSGLNDKYRLPIVLFYFRDLSYDNIAQIMKITVSTVKFRLNYAKELLKKEMEAHK